MEMVPHGDGSSWRWFLMEMVPHGLTLLAAAEQECVCGAHSGRSRRSQIHDPPAALETNTH